MGTPQRTLGKRTARVAALAVLVALTATGCSGDEILRFGWPVGVTEQANQMRTLWTWTVVAALVVGVIVWALIFWTATFHRKKKTVDGEPEELPRQFQYNIPLELFTVIVPTIMVCVLFVFTSTTEDKVLHKDPNPDVKVQVVAFQWNWEFKYEDAGKRDAQNRPVPVKTPDGGVVSTVGSSGEIPLLVLPVGKTIQYDLLSTDVIHSFWVPEFHFKRDVFPNPDKNNQDSSFQNKIDREGSFVGRCAELCGTYHSVMNFEVRALSPDKFDQYIQLRTQVNPATGQTFTASEALTKMNCGELCTPHAVTTQPFNTDRTARTASN
ncbi:cytochrome c oxidase subunit II [Amycolatopsis sp. OK19-0408]|uniref:cytochrome-c oxidase n=1 Tax=Amycolatopsis iheyensis TaxID=2945988 RepID=A0A9X2SRJ2_9PSEU|nr:cytochrome c oxidase subunit II [Amycolatopsis iheyensis]MCR6490105.1 cytochrome c oxidase subunit II [Amycolatopsis iheyensis]